MQIDGSTFPRRPLRGAIVRFALHPFALRGREGEKQNEWKVPTAPPSRERYCPASHRNARRNSTCRWTTKKSQGNALDAFPPLRNLNRSKLSIGNNVVGNVPSIRNNKGHRAPSADRKGTARTSP